MKNDRPSDFYRTPEWRAVCQTVWDSSNDAMAALRAADWLDERLEFEHADMIRSCVAHGDGALNSHGTKARESNLLHSNSFLYRMGFHFGSGIGIQLTRATMATHTTFETKNGFIRKYNHPHFDEKSANTYTALFLVRFPLPEPVRQVGILYPANSPHWVIRPGNARQFPNAISKKLYVRLKGGTRLEASTAFESEEAANQAVWNAIADYLNEKAGCLVAPLY